MPLTSLQSITSASLHPFSSPNRHRRQRTHPPISISTNPSHVDVIRLRHLLASAGHSCHRFPAATGDGRLELADLVKLRTAIDHSFIVVSVFCKDRFLPSRRTCENSEEISAVRGFMDFLERAVQVPSSDHHLVGFGRAVSDGGLTASIHDVVVMPSLQKRGIGQRIVERIVRILANKGIYDISALCSEKEGLFFEACGFGKDPIGSTTMMYTRTASSDQTEKSFHGTAAIMFNEFLAKFSREGDAIKPIIEETGSFQLRKQNSGRPQGFVDISLHISEEREDAPSNPGRKGGLQYTDQANGITLAVEGGTVLSLPKQQLLESASSPVWRLPPGQLSLSLREAATSANLLEPPPAPTPPPAPLNAAYLLPTLFPESTSRPPGSYINLPPARNAGQGSGLGSWDGALAAGAVIFGG